MDASIFALILQWFYNFFASVDAIIIIRVGDDGFSLLDLLLVDLVFDIIIGFIFGIKSADGGDN